MKPSCEPRCTKGRGSPYLQWTGKAERTSFEVDTVSLHVHKRIDPMSILSAVRKRMDDAKAAASPLVQARLFEAPFENLPLRDAIDFCKHDKGWANRLVAGDSLQVDEQPAREERPGRAAALHFPMAGKDEGWKKLKASIRAELDQGLLGQFHGTVSLPFSKGKHGRVAVTIGASTR